MKTLLTGAQCLESLGEVMYFQTVTEPRQHAKHPGKTLTQEADVLGTSLISGQ